ncbi:MAG: hypothetical protein RR653_13470 [Clostridia bacterium]
MFEPWMLAIIDAAGCNGITQAHIERVAQEIRETGVVQIDKDTFEQACYRCMLDPAQFSQEDLEWLAATLNE